MSDQPENRTADGTSVAKKPYEPPVLVQWGTLREMTRTSGDSGNTDGGKGKQPRRTR